MQRNAFSLLPLYWIDVRTSFGILPQHVRGRLSRYASSCAFVARIEAGSAPQRRDGPQWRNEQRRPAERWHDERCVYDDCRCRGERERDSWRNDRSQSHNPRKGGQPKHSSRVGPPIPNERRRDGRQTNDARIPNEHHSSRCADGGDHIEPRKLSALISNAGSAGTAAARRRSAAGRRRGGSGCGALPPVLRGAACRLALL